MKTNERTFGREHTHTHNNETGTKLLYTCTTKKSCYHKPYHTISYESANRHVVISHCSTGNAYIGHRPVAVLFLSQYDSCNR